MKTQIPWDRSVATTLVARAAASSSGILTVTRGKQKRLFCIDEGWLVHAASNILEEQIAPLLVRRGALDEIGRRDVEEWARTRGVKVAQVLLERGLVSDADLTSGIEAWIEELLFTTLDWSEGELSWTAGKPRTTGEVTVRLRVPDLVLRYASRVAGSPGAVRVRIGPPDIRLMAERPEGAADTPVDPIAQYLLGCCDGAQPLAEVVRLSPADEEATVRGVFGLLLLGRLSSATRAPQQRTVRGPEPELTREECLERLALGEGRDHYTILGVDHEARVDRVREAYYALARRYHPDRFRSGPLKSFLPRFEKFFALVTDAYNTLMNPARRAEYDQQLLGGVKDHSAPKEADTTHLAKENFARGKILLDKKRHVEAATFFENAVKLDGSNPEYHLQLGLVLVRSGRRRDEAETHLRKAIGLAPASVAGYVALGSLYQRQHRTAEAVQVLRDALRWDPQNAEAKKLLATIGEKEESPSEGGILRGLFRG